MYSPYLLSSIAHVNFPTTDAGRSFIAETKFINRQVLLGTTKLNLWTTWAKSKEQRLRRRKLVSIAEALQQALVDGAQGKDLPQYQTVCWRSMTTLRRETHTHLGVRRDGEAARRVVEQQVLDDTA